MKIVVERKDIQKAFDHCGDANNDVVVAMLQGILHDHPVKTDGVWGVEIDEQLPSVEAKKREISKLFEMATDAREIAMRLDWLRMDKEKELRK